MSDRLVAIDILTTGFSEERDEIIALAAARIVDGRIADRFHVSARPTGDLPLRAQRTSPADETDAPSESEAIDRFLAFVAEDPIVGHDVEFEARFIEARITKRLRNHVMDVAELARFVTPSADAYDLDTLCRDLSVERGDGGPIGNAEATALLWLALTERAVKLPLAVIAAIGTVLEPTSHPLKKVFQEVEMDAMSRAFEESATLEDLFKDFRSIIRAKRVENPRVPPERLDVAQLSAMFGPGGIVSRALPAYEYREEQVRMAQAVCDAYNNGAFLVVEAGTGTGKSLAYLAPSVMWALKNRETVVVSTNTKNLQEQLFFKDVPLLRKIFPEEFKCALIKGRSNYLCLRKFIYLLREIDRELTTEDRPFVAPLIAWAVETETGDVAENAGFTSQFRPDIWARVSTRRDECAGPQCPHARGCFVRRARALSLCADIVIANHSVVFSEMASDESSVLPQYSHVIFDEAHNIEDAATEHLALRLSAYDIRRVLNRLNRKGRRGAGKGLFTNIRFRLDTNDRETLAGIAGMEARIAASLQIMDEIATASAEFFNTVGLIFLRRDEDDKVRYDGGPRRPECWGAVELSARELSTRLGALAIELLAAETILNEMNGKLEHKRDFARALGAEAAELREIIATLKTLVEAQDEKYVYWVEQARGREIENVLCAAPLEIGELMDQFIYRHKSSVIFSSATMTVGGGFDFMMDRLGLAAISEPDRRRCMALGTSFDFGKQVLFGVPLFLPEPGDAADQFTPRLSEMLGRLLVATRGRALVLFTSYDMLRRTYQTVKQTLEQEGILLLGQGIDGERRKITKIFERDVSSVLMGTQSFWEGVDVPGESLSCLVLAKLPFQVFTEPIVQARCELLTSQGREPFSEYTVPTAVIRLKQGFGRLIRNRADRGVIIVCDRRVATKGYGRRFLNSLPVKGRVFDAEAPMIRAVRAFLDADDQASR